MTITGSPDFFSVASSAAVGRPSPQARENARMRSQFAHPNFRTGGRNNRRQNLGTLVHRHLLAVLLYQHLLSSTHIQEYSVSEMNDELTLLPWGVVTDFLEVKDVLNGRAVCIGWKLGIEEGLSMDWCERHLSLALKHRNCVLIPPTGISVLDASWNKGATQEKLRSLFVQNRLQKHDITTNMVETNHWKQFLLSSRVVRSIPQSLTVAFSNEDGRFCISTEQNNTMKCQPMICSDCPLRPNTIKDYRRTRETSTSNDSMLNERYHEIDGSLNLAKCPERSFVCPNCHTKESLVLGDFSYKSTPDYSTLRLLHDILTFTPCQEVSYSTAVSENEPIDLNIIASSRRVPKKLKLSVESEVPFPPRYVEMALPTREEPIPMPKDAKFGISIHCTHCRDFAILAPAAVCWHSDFVCHKRGQVTYQDGKEITLGGVLVRSKCSAPNCQKATSCPDCSHRVWHDPYTRTGGSSHVRRSSHCVTCKETYCSEHAWLSTTCHHW
jgi:hypothetical protein